MILGPTTIFDHGQSSARIGGAIDCLRTLMKQVERVSDTLWKAAKDVRGSIIKSIEPTNLVSGDGRMVKTAAALRSDHLNIASATSPDVRHICPHVSRPGGTARCDGISCVAWQTASNLSFPLSQRIGTSTLHMLHRSCIASCSCRRLIS